MNPTHFQPTVPDYLAKYPQIQIAVPRVHAMLRQLPTGADRRLYQDGKFELEARFGTLSTDGRNMFQPGVSTEFLQQTLQEVGTFPDWHLVTDWKETHDYYYELPPHPEDLRGQAVLVRTTVDFRKEKNQEAQIVTEHICKQPRDKQDFRFVPGGGNALNTLATVPGMDVRVSLNFEEAVPADSIPTRIKPKFVRIKNRKSFIYQPAHAQNPIWSVDFTKSWSAPTRSDAEMKQRERETINEIEVECLDPYSYMSDPKRDQFYLATSLMLKMRDFVGSDKPFQWEPQYKHSY